ncbi:hypothetical protein ES288_D05G425100v1 [Gossypium darwinii]|uniref:Uncharacterized protein n=1 Tax=Gossypium darwinii TaxID=34276 RepID=A0A5D2CT25_GOSDA|nr:hypothetical protein ES288_D05G425100v1 [Gossypium darwinii]
MFRFVCCIAGASWRCTHVVVAQHERREAWTRPRRKGLLKP